MNIIYFKKKMLAIILFLIMSSFFGYSQPKVAVVLGGGGAKGFTHIGVLKVLEEEGIPIDIIVGTSIGSIAGGLYSIGYTADEIAEISRTNNWEHLLGDYIPRKYLSPQSKALNQRYLLSLPFSVNNKITLPASLVTGQNVLGLFCDLASQVPQEVDFSTLPISFACVATDLETGEEVVLNKGFLPKAIFSSMSIPGAFSPSEYGGRLLVDGGLVNNFPTDVAKKMGADIIIGVDLGSGYKTRDELNSIGDVIDQIVTFNTTAKKAENIKLCDIFIHPNISGYSTGSFSAEAVDTLLHRGYEAGLSVVDQIRALKEKYDLKPRTVSREYMGEKRWEITEIEISGNTIMNKENIRNNLGLVIPGKYTSHAINNAIYDLKGYGSVEMAYYSLSDNPTGKTLQLNVKETDAAELKIGKTMAHLNVGMNINSTDAIQLMLNSTTKRYRKWANLFSIDAVVSPNPELSILTESSRGRLPSLGMLLQGKYSKYNFFVNGKKSNSAETYYGAGSIYAHRRMGYFLDFGGGVKQEYFNGKIFGAVNENLQMLENGSAFFTNFYSYLKYDDLNDYYFPTKGTEIYAEYSLLNETKSINDLGSAVLFKMRGIVSLSPKVAMIFNVNGRALFNNNISPYKRTIVGGEDYDVYMNYHLPFIGINRVSNVSDFAATFLTGIRFNLLKTHFVTLKGNLFFDNNDLQNLSATRVLWGAGASYTIKSGIGPLEITGGFSDYYGNSNFTFNLGYWF